MFTNTYIYATKVLNRGFGLRRVSSKISLPVLGIDIDGVLRRGWNPLPGALEAINILKTPLSLLSPSKFGSLDPSIRIPFRLLSNGGGDPEIIKANELNKLLKLEEEKVLEERDLILCHTPIRQIAHQYRDKYVLVSGQGDTLSVMLNYGFNKIITVDEYSSFFPHMYRLVNQWYYIYVYLYSKGKEVVEESKSQAMRRLNLPQPFAEPPQIHAIFLISDCKILEETLQIASDLLISKDGIAGSIREIEDPQFVKFYLSNGDLLYSDNFSIPRHAQGTLMHCLKAIHDLQFPGREVEYIQYGKPTALTYQYMSKRLNLHLV